MCVFFFFKGGGDDVALLRHPDGLGYYPRGARSSLAAEVLRVPRVLVAQGLLHIFVSLCDVKRSCDACRAMSRVMKRREVRIVSICDDVIGCMYTVYTTARDYIKGGWKCIKRRNIMSAPPPPPPLADTHTPPNLNCCSRFLCHITTNNNNNNQRGDASLGVRPRRHIAGPVEKDRGVHSHFDRSALCSVGEENNNTDTSYSCLCHIVSFYLYSLSVVYRFYSINAPNFGK